MKSKVYKIPSSFGMKPRPFLSRKGIGKGSIMQSQRTMAAKILKCGESRVWLDPMRVADIEEAITSEDVRHLIKDGVIAEKPKRGLSSFRKKKIAKQKKKGRRRNRGSVKGHKGTRLQKKQSWMKTVRSLRRLLRDLRTDGKVDNKTYRDLYTKSKSGYFRSKAHVMNYLERNNLLKSEGKPEANKK